MRLHALPIALAAALAEAASAQDHAMMIQHAYLWERPSFQGRAITIVGGFDDLAAKRLPAGAGSGSFEGEWTICDAPRLAGHCAVVHGKAPDVTRAGLSGPVMSLSVVRR